MSHYSVHCFYRQLIWPTRINWFNTKWSQTKHLPFFSRRQTRKILFRDCPLAPAYVFRSGENEVCYWHLVTTITDYTTSVYRKQPIRFKSCILKSLDRGWFSGSAHSGYWQPCTLKINKQTASSHIYLTNEKGIGHTVGRLQAILSSPVAFPSNPFFVWTAQLCFRHVLIAVAIFFYLRFWAWF